METIEPINYQIATLLVRVFLGVLFFAQGYDTLIRITPKALVKSIETSFLEKGISIFWINAGVWFTSVTELAGGFFLLLGYAKYVVLFLLGCNLIVATVAFSTIRPMWDLNQVFPRLLLLVFLLVCPPNWDCWSIDSFLNNHKI